MKKITILEDFVKMTRLTKLLFTCLFCVIISSALAYWAEPYLLSELNDYENGYAANRPTISADESILFFVRPDSTGQSRVWEAQRNPETGLFDNQRMLTELRQYGQGVYGTWISEDNKRLYYAGYNPDRSRRQILMATRDNPWEQWRDVRLHNELDINILLSCCSLTSDEKYIMYQATPNTNPRQRKIYFAVRNSIEESFSYPQESHELNDIGADFPTVSPDGLTVYFGRAIANEPGEQELWVGHRNSLEEPFGNFEPLNEINDNGHSVMGWFSPSWDGQRLYYLQRNGEPGNWDLNSTGIYVSHWIDPPEVIVDKNLVAAIEAKNATLEQLTATIEMENETLEILGTLKEMTEKGSESYNAIQKTMIQIQKALQDEISAKNKIQDSIAELEEALSCYHME